MPSEQDVKTDVQEEVSQEARDEADMAKAAVDSQAKPADLVEKEEQQAELREKRKTPSSTSLPVVQLFEDAGDLVAKIADKVVKLGDALHFSNDIGAGNAKKVPVVEEAAVPPLEIQHFDEKVLADAARTIYEACEGKVEAADHQALKFLKRAGTNDAVIVETLSDMTETERQELARVYQNNHGIPLALHLLSEMETPEEQEYMMKLLIRKDGEVVEKRKTSKEIAIENVDRDKMWEAAEVLHGELGTGWTNHDKVFTTLEALTEAERDVLRPIYAERYGETLRDALESEYSGEDEQRALAVLYRQDATTQADGVDSNAMEKAAEAIQKAMDGADDIDTVYSLLKDKTESERRIIDAYYLQKTGLTLEADFKEDLSGAELDRALNLLHRKDGSDDEAGRIHTALTERDQLIEGRSDEECEKDLRDTLATMNSGEIERAKTEYESRYGQSLEAALLDDENLSYATKESLKIHLKGSDSRTDEDSLQLADIALAAQDIDMYKEVMSKASPESRQSFMENGGKERLDEAFGTKWYGYIPHVAIYGRAADAVFDTEIAPNLTDTELQHATDYGQEGKLSAETELHGNQSWLGDNERGIEQTLAKLADEEREAYRIGRALAQGDDVPDLTDDRIATAREFYNKIHGQLDDAGDATEVARWEDMIARKGGTLISRLAEHDGITDDTSAVLKEIENMSEQEWNRLKGPDGPQYAKEIETALGTYLSDEQVARCMEVIFIKKAMSSFEDAAASGRRSIVDALNDAARDSFRFYGQDVSEEEVFRVIREMSPEDQLRYRTDCDFRQSVDDLVTSLLDGREDVAAVNMLENVKNGREPGDDIVSKLLVHAADTDTNEAQVIRDVIREFRDNPAVRDKVLNPTSTDDESFKLHFRDALGAALGSSDFEKYGKPLIDSGHLPFDLQLELNKGVFDDDEHGFYEDIVNLVENEDDWSRKEANRILGDETYKAEILESLSDEERQVAVHVLEQGELRTEDKIRACVIGAGTDEDRIKTLLTELEPGEKEVLKSEYARKYGEDLTDRLLQELGGQDAIDAGRAIRRQHEDTRSAFNEARDEYYESRSGFGSDWVDSMWDATGYQSDEAYAAFAAAIAEHAARFEELPAEQRGELLKDLQQSVDQFRESKGALADGITDAYIAVGCVAAGFVTEGSTWALLGALAAGGFFKTGVKGAIMGSDYDWDSSAALADFAVGGADAALNMITFGAGSTAAKAILKEGGKTLLKEGAEESLENGLVRIVRESIRDGSSRYSNDAVRELVDNVAAEGADRQALESIVRKNLDQAIKQQADRIAGQLARESDRLPARPDPAWAEPGKYKFADGTEMEVFKPGRWVQPIENIPLIPVEAKGVKAHVFTSDAGDLELLQQVLMRALRDDPDLVGHVSWKTFDPKNTPDGAVVGQGQARKAFTLEARSPEELARVARKIDEIIARHPELRPVAPEGVDQLIGTSGRVAIVRDRFPLTVDAAGNEGAKLHDSLSASILDGLKLERETSTGKLTDSSIRAIETRLREVEDAAQLKPNCLTVDKDGNLMLRATSEHSEPLEGKFYLDEHKAQAHPRGAEYNSRVPEVDLDGNPVLDPATGEPKMIEKALRSEGLTDRPAYYKLAEMYGVDPALELRSSMSISRVEAADVSPSIKAIGARADIPEEVWASRVAYISENELARPETIESFLRRAADATSAWDDRSFLNTVLERSAEDLRGAVSRYKEIVCAKQGLRDGSADRELIALLDKPDEVRLRFKDDPDVQRALDEYYRARDIHAEVARDLHGIVKQRESQFQQLLNDFADGHGLPRAELTVTDDAHMVGAYGTYGDGVIRLRESNVLSSNDPLKLMETAYHEFAHNAQDSLMIRSVVDEVESRVGRSLTPDVFDRIRVLNKRWVENGSLSDSEMTEMVDLERSVSEVRKRYAEVSGGGMHSDHLREVLRARDGQRLTPDELQRAHEVSDAWRKNAPPGDKLIRLGNDLEVTRGEMHKLNLLFGEHRLIQRLIEDNGTLSRHLFGTAAPPPEVQTLMITYRSGDSVPERWLDARALLQKHLGQREENVVSLCRQINKDYMQFHEQEAFVLGAWLKDLADSLGVTGRPLAYIRSGTTVPDGLG